MPHKGMAKRDYYEVLGLSRGASEAEIKKAYRRLARKLHPDVNPGDKAAQKRFQEVQEAYDVLKDAEKRRAYDRFGHAGPGAGFDPRHGRGAGFSAGGFPGAAGRRIALRGDPFRVAATSATSSATSSAGGRSTGPEPGEDMRGQIEVPFRDAVLGGTATLSLRREKPCPTCGGTGRTGKTVCATCRGEGVVAESERVRIKIPEGTEDGGTIRIPGKGGAGARGGPVGDLYVTVRVLPHPYFERHGNDIQGIVPDHGQGGLRRRRDRRADDPRRRDGEDSARHAGPPAVPPARQGREGPAHGTTGDHIYIVARHGPEDAEPGGPRRRDAARSLYEGNVRAELPKGL